MHALPLTPGRLVCLVCGWTAGCSPDAQARFMRTKVWPECCGQVMAFCPVDDEPEQPVPE